MLHLRIQEIINSRDITQKQLAEMTGIRAASINAICRDSQSSINKDHLTKIMVALGIDDISQVIEYEKEDRA